MLLLLSAVQQAAAEPVNFLSSCNEMTIQTCQQQGSLNSLQEGVHGAKAALATHTVRNHHPLD